MLAWLQRYTNMYSLYAHTTSLNVEYFVCPQIKCDQYWPPRGAETYGLMHVQLVDVTELATYTIRTFHMSRVSLINSASRVILMANIYGRACRC